LTLPALIRRLRVEDDGREIEEERGARISAAEAALERLERLGAEEWVRQDTLERMRGLYDYRRRRFTAQVARSEEDDDYETRARDYQRMIHEVIDAQREALVRLRDEQVISSDVMRRIERELDLEETRLEY
jgi:CPA1 family monovalent cation:H+ antiporter